MGGCRRVPDASLTMDVAGLAGLVEDSQPERLEVALAVLGTLLPAGWAARTRAANALRAE